jgi:hypothetical protein
LVVISSTNNYRRRKKKKVSFILRLFINTNKSYRNGHSIGRK